MIAVVYEARPNVTIDAAALCLKSGNAVVLRGSSSAAHSNAVLAGVAAEAADRGRPAATGAMALLAGGDREELAELATQTGVVDLIIPRGGEGLKAALKGVATVPVIYAASGNNHVYVDASADLESAQAIVLNAKLQRPGTCNAAEKLLVHADVAGPSCPACWPPCSDAGVTLHGDERARAAAPGVAIDAATRGGLGHRVPGARAGGRGGRLRRRGDRPHQCPRQRALRGDRDARHRRRPAPSSSGRRRLRVRQRLDPLHRRRPVRQGRRDRQLDPEASRPRPDRPARSCARSSTWSRARATSARELRAP